MATTDRPRHSAVLPDGRSLAYVVWPEEAAHELHSRRVVFHLHGTLASGDDVFLMMGAAHDQEAAAALARTVAIVGLDRPGFGESAAAGSRPNLLDVARDVAALARTLLRPGQPWYVEGYSAGGPFALALGRLAPEGLQRVTLIASPWPWRDGQREPTALWQAAADTLGPLPPRMFYGAVSSVVGPTFLRRCVGLSAELAAELGSSMQRFVQQGTWAAAWEMHCVLRGARPAGFELHEVLLPVHIFHGSDDKLVDASHATRLERALPRATLTHLDGDHYGVSRHSAQIFLAATADVEPDEGSS